MTRIKLLASVVTFGIAVLWCGVAFAGTITAPTAPFTVPLNTAGTGPAPFAVSVAGYTPGTQVFLIICDGTPSTATGWDPSIFCDNVTSPQAAQVQSDGTAMWNPATSKNQAIGIFDGASPGGDFNCYYPGETAFSNGEMDPSDGLPSWTNCQIRVASTNGAVTSDQAFLTFTLPVPSGVTVTTTTTTPGSTTTTTTPSGTTTSTTTSTVPSSSTTTTTTTSTTVPGATSTTSSTVAGSSTTSSTVAGSSTTSSTVTGAATTSSTADGGLAVTGIDSDGLVLLGICLIALGVLAKSRARGRSDG